MKSLERFLEWSGNRKDIVCLGREAHRQLILFQSYHFRTFQYAEFFYCCLS